MTKSQQEKSKILLTLLNHTTTAPSKKRLHSNANRHSQQGVNMFSLNNFKKMPFRVNYCKIMEYSGCFTHYLCNFGVML